MSKEKANKATKATATKNTDIVLGLAKPLTGGKLKGWTLCECTKTSLRLIGESELSAILNNADCTLNEDIIKACKKGLDLGRALSVGITLARKLNYTPCRAFTLYGDGATQLVKTMDYAAKQMAKYTNATAAALTELLKGKESERKALFAAYDKAVKAEKEQRTIYNKATKKYRKDCKIATELLTMNDIRKA